MSSSSSSSSSSLDMTEWVDVCASIDVGQEPVRQKLRDKTEIALIRHNGRLLAMSNRCPHKDASLHKSGDIEDFGGDLGICLRCPKHKNKFGGGLFVSFSTGKCVTRSPCSNSKKVATWAVPVYETKEHAGIVSIRRVDPHLRAKPSIAVSADEQETRLVTRVVQVRRVSPDSHVFVLQLLDERDRAAFAHEPAAMWHIWLAVGGVSREYTPISSSVDTASTGTIDLLIKLYEKGQMSRQLAKLEPGDTVAVSPPIVTLQVPALEKASMPRGLSFNLLAGGTGIAPCLQLLRKAKAARASVRMLYSSWTYDHVLLASELEEMADCWPDRGFCYTHVLTRAKTDSSDRVERQPKWPRTVATICGRHIDATIVQDHMAGLAESNGVTGGQPDAVMTLISGPSGFNTTCKDLVDHTLVPVERGEVVVLDA